MPSNHVAEVIAYCPKCFSEPENIELWNCGPIVKLRCPVCHFGFNDSEPEAGKYTVEGLIKLWNKNGMYYVQD